MSHYHRHPQEQHTALLPQPHIADSTAFAFGHQEPPFYNMNMNPAPSERFNPAFHARKGSDASMPGTLGELEAMSLDELSIGFLSLRRDLSRIMIPTNLPPTPLDNSHPGQLHSSVDNSNNSMSLLSSSSPTSSTPCSPQHALTSFSSALSTPVYSPVSASTPGVSPPVAGSSPNAFVEMDYMLTNSNYMFLQHPPHPRQQQQQQQQHRHQHHHQHQHHLQQQQQQLQQRPHSALGPNPTPSNLLSSSEFQGQNGPHHPINLNGPWNISIASNPSSVHLTSAPLAPPPVPSVAWANPQPGFQYYPRQGHLQQQRPSKGRNHPHPLHIMTSLDSGLASMYTPHVAISGGADSAIDLTLCHPSPPMAGPNYAWGFPSSTSPVESCFPSGSSTPSFATMSPSLSFNSDHSGTSCESSRATSPSFAHASVFDGSNGHGVGLSERRLKRLEAESASSIIRARKSSTSSTSSNVSQRRMSTLRESTTFSMTDTSSPASPSSPVASDARLLTSPSTGLTLVSTSSPTHQCPKCGQCFAGPAVLVRHIESIHDKLLWNCVGCKSNLSRRDAVTRHINLSPMDSICRSVGTIGQIKTSNGADVQYEVSAYRAKPLDEVMSRMGKKISTTLRKEIDRAKALNGAMASTSASAQGVEYQDADAEGEMMDSEMMLMMEYLDEDENKKRRRGSQSGVLGRKKKV